MKSTILFILGLSTLLFIATAVRGDNCDIEDGEICMKNCEENLQLGQKDCPAGETCCVDIQMVSADDDDKTCEELGEECLKECGPNLDLGQRGCPEGQICCTDIQKRR